MPVPVIETDRILLRAHRIEDLDAISQMWAKPQVVRYIGAGNSLSSDEVWNRFLRFAGLWSYFDFGFWVIEERASGRLIGEVGFNVRSRSIPSIGGVPECGCALVPEAQGQGYAEESVKAALAWHERRFGRTKVICIINPENRASIRLAKRCGFEEFAPILLHGNPRILFVHG
jgi:RimJ/RimL family protein N-acetyltransferase